MDAYPLSIPITETLASFVNSIDYDRLPESAKENAKLFFLDYVAATHAGFRVNYNINKIVEEIVLNDSILECSSVFFSDKKTAPITSAFLNAFYAHGADMDDGNKLAAGHIGAHVISAVSSLAETRGVTYSCLYASMIAGYEVFCRLSSACMPYMVEKGFHSTGVAGALASAASCSKLLGLDSDGVANAISLSATQASGLLLAGESRQDMKALNPANAARVGVFAALLAEKGVKGPLQPLESDKGWLHAMAPQIDAKLLLDNLGKKYCIDQCYLKPYPSCRHTHSAIEAVLELRRHVKLSEIESLRVVTYGHAIDLAGKIDYPMTIGEAKFSIKYSVAVAFCRGRFGLQDLNAKNLQKNEKELISKITIMRDDTYERPAEGVRGARVEVRTLNGRSLQYEVLVHNGDQENPFNIDDVKEKMRLCYSDDMGQPNPFGADAFLDWYLPILDDPDNQFIFPQQREIQ